MSSGFDSDTAPGVGPLAEQVAAALARRTDVRLELGCGYSKRDPRAIGIDMLALPGVDVVGDAQGALELMATGSVASIDSEHFMEHIADPYALFAECVRVLQPSGVFRAVIPHFSNPWFYSDPTHSTYFGLYTFDYWVQESPFKRQVPRYSAPMPMSLIHARHVFKSNRPFVFRHAIKKMLSAWVNTSIGTQEFYEEHLTWLMPCYEVEYLLRRLPPDAD
jgi:SAM-dependent methyltransferase